MHDENMEQYYRERAPEYEQIYYRDNPERRQEIDDQAGQLRKLVAGKKVLELASGTGYWTRVMSETAESILASDLSAEMLKEAEAKKYNCPVSMIAADMFTHAFDENAFDVVALGFWFSHQPKQSYDALFDVLCKPLKQMGCIWMIDNNPPAEGPVMHSVGEDDHGNNFKKRYLDDGTEYVILKNYFEQAELESAFGNRFRIESLIHKTYYWSAVLTPAG